LISCDLTAAARQAKRRAQMQPADQRPQHAGHPEHRAEQPLVATAVGRRNDVADDRLGADHQPSTADPLQRAEGDQLTHRLAQTRQG
jgi:hypothetical protein